MNRHEICISLPTDPPVITLQLGSKLHAGDIKEGDDVYFECKIDANPKYRRLTWLHNVSSDGCHEQFKLYGLLYPQGRPLRTNSSTKIVKSNQSLVLQRVTRSSAGKYSCSALNSEGETVSNEFLLKVKFVPLCATDKMMVVGATKGEDIQLACEIKSYPLPKRFYWKFENSEESVEIDLRKYSNNGTRSVLSFSTATDHVTCTSEIKTLGWLINFSNFSPVSGLRQSLVLGEERDWRPISTLHLSINSRRSPGHAIELLVEQRVGVARYQLQPRLRRRSTARVCS